MNKILRYLVALGENNSNEWFERNRSLFTASQGLFACEAKRVMNMMAEADPRFADIKVRSCIQRMLRCARFSRTQENPYRTSFAAVFSPYGTVKEGHAAYCLHLEPGNNSYVSGGVLTVSATMNRRVRQYITRHSERYKAIIEDEAFKQAFPTVGDDELQRMSTAFDRDAESFSYLLPHTFVVRQRIIDRDFSKKDWQATVARQLLLMKPFVDFIEEANAKMA